LSGEAVLEREATGVWSTLVLEDRLPIEAGRSWADDGRVIVEDETIAEFMGSRSREVVSTGSTASAAMTASAVNAAVEGSEMELLAIDDKGFNPAKTLLGEMGMRGASSASSWESVSLLWSPSGCAAEL